MAKLHIGNHSRHRQPNNQRPQKCGLFYLTPTAQSFRIFSLSTESRDWRPECYERLGKTVAQSGFFYSRKSENHTFKRYPQIGEPFQKGGSKLTPPLK